MARLGLLPAAGKARRLGISSPKELLVHRGRPVIDHSVAHLVQAGVERLVVVSRPDKQEVVDHLVRAWPGLDLVVVDQPEPIGNLLDALVASVAALAGHEVLLLFPDTYLEPNPFTFDGGTELTLLCHDAGDKWDRFGVVDPVARRVVEKPATDRGHRLCWGAAAWRPEFTERLRGVTTLTDAINQADWRHAQTIALYEDIGLGPVA